MSKHLSAVEILLIEENKSIFDDLAAFVFSETAGMNPATLFLLRPPPRGR